MPYTDEQIRTLYEGMPERAAARFVRDHLDCPWTVALTRVRTIFGR